MSDLRTASFRKQHVDIVETVERILKQLNPEELKTNSHGVRKLLNKLSSQVKVHLILEDKALYPVIVGINIGDLKEISQQYMEEMNLISSEFGRYMEKWASGSDIRDAVEQFIDETKVFFESLQDRIERENTILYQMIDAL